MCTVTFIPKSDNTFILTSSRDEAPDRDTIPPAIYRVEGVQCLFPKDAVAGGTWLGVSEKSRLICLLNGGFEAHERENTYRMSRGIVVKHLLVAEDLVAAVDIFDFNGIEPFTLIAVEYKDTLRLLELVWDGVTVHFSEKPPMPTIWSSSLLYTTEMKLKREQWFSQFLKKKDVTSDSLLNFHKTAGEGDIAIDLIMDRDFVRTKSITQVTSEDDKVAMRYEDLQVQKISEVELKGVRDC